MSPAGAGIVLLVVGLVAVIGASPFLVDAWILLRIARVRSKFPGALVVPVVVSPADAARWTELGADLGEPNLRLRLFGAANSVAVIAVDSRGVHRVSGRTSALIPRGAVESVRPTHFERGLSQIRAAEILLREPSSGSIIVQPYLTRLTVRGVATQEDVTCLASDLLAALGDGPTQR